MTSRWLAAAIAAGFASQAGAADVAPRRVIVTGHGAAEAAPDLARARFGVSERAPDAAAAYAAAARAAAGVVAAVAALGVAPTDVQTVSLELHPVHAGGGDAPLRIEGYEARSILSATVRDLSRLGPMLDAAAAAGASAVEGVSFDVADRAPLEDAARRAAVADARRTAALLAEGAGAALGAPLELSLQSFGRPMAAMMRMAADEAMPVMAGALTVTAEVSAVFALE